MESQIIATDGDRQATHPPPPPPPHHYLLPTSAGARSRAPARGSCLYSFPVSILDPVCLGHAGLANRNSRSDASDLAWLAEAADSRCTDLDHEVDLMLADAAARCLSASQLEAA